MVLAVKKLPANAGDMRHMGSVPGSGRAPGEGLSNPPSILAWGIPWTEGPGGIQSMGSPRTEETVHAHC